MSCDLDAFNSSRPVFLAYRTSPNILFFVISLNLRRAEASVTATAGARETHALQLPGLAVGKHLHIVRREHHVQSGEEETNRSEVQRFGVRLVDRTI